MGGLLNWNLKLFLLLDDLNSFSSVLKNSFFCSSPGSSHIISDNFKSLYSMMSGTEPNLLSAFGYDAANLALGMLYSKHDQSAYLFDPSGYVGANGLFRLRPNGTNERALQIVRINGDGTTIPIKTAPINFINQIYFNTSNYITPAESMPLASDGINPSDYMNIPDRLRGKYKSKKYGANTVIQFEQIEPINTASVIIQPQEDFSITAENYEPVNLEKVNRKNIDSIEITE